MKIIKIVVIVLLFLIALALGAQNQTLVSFNYLLAQGEFHLSTLLGVVLLFGFLLAWMLFAGVYLKTRLEIRRLKRDLNKSITLNTSNKPKSHL